MSHQIRFMRYQRKVANTSKGQVNIMLLDSVSRFTQNGQDTIAAIKRGWPPDSG